MIQILQEVAAARSVQLTCGPDRLDGYAFAVGLESWGTFHRLPENMKDPVLSITYLLKQAMFRPYHSWDDQETVSLQVCPLGVLLDMYHAHEATKRHDKVYALLGMSSDVSSKVGLNPDYSLPWEELMERLLRHVLSNRVAIDVVKDRQAAVIRGRGVILGSVLRVHKDPLRGDRRLLHVSLIDTTCRKGHVWKVQVTANQVRSGDIVCVLEQALHPSIVRAHKDYFSIISIAVEILDMWRSDDYSRFGGFLDAEYRQFLLVCDWENPVDRLQDIERFDAWTWTVDWKIGRQRSGIDSFLAEARRLWNVTLILDDVYRGRRLDDLHTLCEVRGRTVIQACEMMVEHDTSHTSESGSYAPSAE